MKIKTEIADFLQRRRLFQLRLKRKRENSLRDYPCFTEERINYCYDSDINHRVCLHIIERLGEKKNQNKEHGFIVNTMTNDLLNLFFGNPYVFEVKPYQIKIRRN